MPETIDTKRKQKWLDLVNKHKPADLDIDPDVCAQLLANQEKLERGEIKPKRTFKDIIVSHFGKPTKKEKEKMNKEIKRLSMEHFNRMIKGLNKVKTHGRRNH